MNDEQYIPTEFRRCPAMIREGISNPNSKAGINFCVNRCPYPEGCVAVEATVKFMAYWEKVRVAKELRKRRVTMDDIALVLGVDRATVTRYLRRKVESEKDGLGNL